MGDIRERVFQGVPVQGCKGLAPTVVVSEGANTMVGACLVIKGMESQCVCFQI